MGRWGATRVLLLLLLTWLSSAEGPLALTALCVRGTRAGVVTPPVVTVRGSSCGGEALGRAPPGPASVNACWAPPSTTDSATATRG